MAMIITRTPFRISFAGGGTDLKAYYAKEAGKVISTSIDKYIYVVIKRQIGIVEHKYRINWSKVEFKDSIDKIEHQLIIEDTQYLLAQIVLGSGSYFIGIIQSYMESTSSMMGLDQSFNGFPQI